MSHVPQSIKLETYETAGWRIRRLARFLDRLPEETAEKLASLHDSKGDLRVVFRDGLTVSDQARIIAAWKAEGEPHVFMTCHEVDPVIEVVERAPIRLRRI